MDWLEAWFPFLRDLDGGDGALELSLVLVIALVVAMTAIIIARRLGTNSGGRR
jgi:hypothetical protein